MIMRAIAITMILVLSLTGCASMSNWTPVVDTKGDAHAQRISQDEQECKQLAQKSSGGTADETLKGTAIGGLLGAAAGAAIGAAVGRPGTGAAIGAAAGGFGGGAKQGFGAEDQYKQAFRNCMKGRGHKVIG